MHEQVIGEYQPISGLRGDELRHNVDVSAGDKIPH